MKVKWEQHKDQPLEEKLQMKWKSILKIWKAQDQMEEFYISIPTKIPIITIYVNDAL